MITIVANSGKPYGKPQSVHYCPIAVLRNLGHIKFWHEFQVFDLSEPTQSRVSLTEPGPPQRRKHQMIYLKLGCLLVDSLALLNFQWISTLKKLLVVWPAC